MSHRPQTRYRPCKVCRGWGKGLVGATGMCRSCTRQIQDTQSEQQHIIPTQTQANIVSPIANEIHAQLWIKRHYPKLMDALTWTSMAGEKREETIAMPLPESMSLDECVTMANHHGFGARREERKMCTCQESGFFSYFSRCVCPREEWIVYSESIEKK